MLQGTRYVIMTLTFNLTFLTDRHWCHLHLEILIKNIWLPDLTLLTQIFSHSLIEKLPITATELTDLQILDDLINDLKYLNRFTN